MNGSAGKPKVIAGTILAKVQLALGIVIVAFFLLGTLGSIIDGSIKDISFVIVLALILALGVWLILRGVKKEKMIKRFKKYVTVLSTDPDRSLVGLAAALGMGVDAVRADVEQMIKRGYFVRAYINQEANSLVFAGRVPAGQAARTAPAPEQGASSPAAGGMGCRTVVCKGCGAVNQIPVGEGGECEFCGAQLL